MKPIKIRDVRNQLPQAGRIRAGKKTTGGNGKERPTALRNFRFTSSDRTSIEQVAKLYGGAVAPWNDPKAAPNQWEVITESNEIGVILPVDPLSESWYELWGGGACQRRCDGETVTLAVGGGPDGSEPLERPCVCDAQGLPEPECKLTTRLNVILPEVRFLGLWRLDTKGYNAFVELPEMVATIQALQDRPGFTRAILRLEQRQLKRPGKPLSKFVVPTLGLDASPDQIMAGEAQARVAIETPRPCPGCASVYSEHLDDCPHRRELADDTVPALPPYLGGEGRDDYPMGGADDDVVDAELVDDGPIVLTEVAGGEGYRNDGLTQAWADSLTTAQRAKVLVKAREGYTGKPDEIYTRFDQIPLNVLDELSGNGTP